MRNAIDKLKRLYPEIEWSHAEPNDEILKDYGNGIVLRGEMAGKVKEFFILEEDRDKVKWGHVIANYLHETVVHE